MAWLGKSIRKLGRIRTRHMRASWWALPTGKLSWWRIPGGKWRIACGKWSLTQPDVAALTLAPITIAWRKSGEWFDAGCPLASPELDRSSVNDDNEAHEDYR